MAHSRSKLKEKSIPKKSLKAGTVSHKITEAVKLKTAKATHKKPVPSKTPAKKTLVKKAAPAKPAVKKTPPQKTAAVKTVAAKAPVKKTAPAKPVVNIPPKPVELRSNIRCRSCFMVDGYYENEEICHYCKAKIYAVDAV